LGRLYVALNRSDLAAVRVAYAQVVTELERYPEAGWVVAPARHFHTQLLRRAGEYAELGQQLSGWISLLHDLGQQQHMTLLLVEEVIVLAQSGDLQLARSSLERARAAWPVGDYTFVDYLRNVGEIWLLLGEGDAAAARALAERTRDEVHRHRLARFKMMKIRMHETWVVATLADAIARDDADAVPGRRTLRVLRRSKMPKFVATSWILEAGGASLHDDREHEIHLWREALKCCETMELRGFAAAVRVRLAELGVDDRDALQTAAHDYFVAQRIADVDRLVDLLAPARRRGDR
ncbi:MAG: hypothetical protein KC457_29385, partial [Myxococcales bacterium]|nr:hypothetical protein [Myxococcales bacterium]